MTGKTVILAAGDFPADGGEAFQTLAAASHVVACDSAGDAYFARFGRWPDVVVGDLDSARAVIPCEACRVVHIREQETNDLAKAIRFCREEGWRDVILVGATGKREDHTLGNIFRALDEQIPIITETGIFHPVCGRMTFQTGIGRAVSIFAPDPTTRLTSRGLAWPLDGVRPTALYVATLNRTTAETIEVSADRPIFVFIAAQA